MSAPNILLLMADQLRADALGCSGEWVNTPHMDSVAAQGTMFSNAVTTSPICVPARNSLATGLYPHNTGIWGNTEHDLPAGTPTWMQAVRSAGYRTSLFGKTHLHRHQGDLREREHLLHAHGLDDVNEIAGPRASARCLSYMTERWEQLGLWQKYREDYAERFAGKPWVARPSVLPLEEYADFYVGACAAEYLASYDRSEPWFCWVSFGGPHAPWDAPEPYASLYRPEEMPKPAPAADWLRNLSPSTSLGSYAAKTNAMTAEEVAALRANYAGNVTLIDDMIGRILDVIRSRREYDNTIVVIASDHGEMNGDHGLIYKGHFLDGAVRVPLVVRTPASACQDQIHPRAARICSDPVEWIDIGPTLAELAGATLGHRQFGRSLCGAIEGSGGPHREFAISEISRDMMIMDRRWKMAVDAQLRPYLLFDQQHDPQEQVNLAGDPHWADVRAHLREQLLERLALTLN